MAIWMLLIQTKCEGFIFSCCNKQLVDKACLAWVKKSSCCLACIGPWSGPLGLFKPTQYSINILLSGADFMLSNDTYMYFTLATIDQCFWTWVTSETVFPLKSCDEKHKSTFLKEKYCRNPRSCHPATVDVSSLWKNKVCHAYNYREIDVEWCVGSVQIQIEI